MRRISRTIRPIRKRLVRTRRRTFPENISPRMHTVEKDETIESIAEKYCVSEDTLRYLNSLEENDSLEKMVGSSLCIERAESTTHRRIKRLRQSLNKHTFLAYTATPMAQFLISTVKSIFFMSITPSDRISLIFFES